MNTTTNNAYNANNAKNMTRAMLRIAVTVVTLISGGLTWAAENTSGVPVPKMPAFNKSSAGYGKALANYLDRFDTGWRDYYGKAKMTLYDARGDAVQRSVIQMLLEQKGGDKSLIKFLRPADIRGVAALIHEHPKATDDSWLYLPASRRTRRISGANRTASFQGTEFTYEDLSSLVVQKYRWRHVGDVTVSSDGRRVKVVKLEARPTYRDTGYSRLVVSLNRDLWRVERIDYFDKAGRKLKTLTNSQWRHRHGRFWRAMKLEMRNHQTRKRTVLQIERQYLNLALYKGRDGRARANFDDSYFTKRAIEGR